MRTHQLQSSIHRHPANSGSDYTQVETDGTLVAHGAAVCHDDVYPSALSVGTGGNAPSFTAYSGNMMASEFVGLGAAAKEVFAQFQIYHSYDEGTTVIPHIHLYIPDNVTGGNIKFSMEYHWENVDTTGAIVTSTATGTITRAANAGISSNHILSFGNVAGTGKTISSILSARIYRDPSDAGDTFGASVWLRSGDVHISKNTMGSRTELVK